MLAAPELSDDAFFIFEVGDGMPYGLDAFEVYTGARILYPGKDLGPCSIPPGMRSP